MDTPKLPGTDVKHMEACQLDRELQTFVQYLFWPGLRVLLGSLTRPVQAHHGSARCQDAFGVQHAVSTSPAFLTQTGLTDRLMFTALSSDCTVLFK